MIHGGLYCFVDPHGQRRDRQHDQQRYQDGGKGQFSFHRLFLLVVDDLLRKKGIGLHAGETTVHSALNALMKILFHNASSFSRLLSCFFARLILRDTDGCEIFSAPAISFKVMLFEPWPLDATLFHLYRRFNSGKYSLAEDSSQHLFKRNCSLSCFLVS